MLVEADQQDTYIQGVRDKKPVGEKEGGNPCTSTCWGYHREWMWGGSPTHPSTRSLGWYLTPHASVPGVGQAHPWSEVGLSHPPLLGGGAGVGGWWGDS